jgi:hypothetical protein
MDRNYTNGSHNDTQGNRTFVGVEVENTPMRGNTTLFVVGIQDADTVATIADAQGIKHIYLGANHSFDTNDHWENFVFALLKLDFWVTLDFDIRHTEWVLECGFTEHRRFIPMISAKLPYINQLGYNACLKLDDKGFEASNTGVWVHSIHNLMSRETYTDWDQYKGDTLV